MKTTPAISIIIPVYKAEEYLRRCVESVIAQTFKDWELILVDDGSPDSSGEICDELVIENPNCAINVIHKPNGGVASAREAGMQAAKGVYSIHIDPDDWIECDTLECLYDKAVSENIDIVVFDFLLDYGTNHQEISCQQVSSCEELLNGILSQRRHGSVCNKLIRTNLYHRYDIHFPSQMICWEDLYVCCNLLFNQCQVSYIPRAFYHYDLHTNQSSMTRHASIATIEGMKFFCNYISQQLKEEQSRLVDNYKALVKITAYRCNLMSATQLRDLYSEINEGFIQRYRLAYDKSVYYGLSLVLEGKSLKTASRRERLANLYWRLRTRLVKAIK